MPLLNDEVHEQLRLALSELVAPVKLVVFTQEMECQFCRENRMLAEEVASATDKIKLEIYNFILDKSQVEQYKIARIPALVVAGEQDHGIRFYGIPAGFEFASLVAAIKMVSLGDPQLSEPVRSQVQALAQPVNIKVFVTLTCPYCPTQVHTAHRIAMASSLITAEMIESAEFPVLASKFSVMGVPRTVFNDTYSFEGAVPEELFVQHLLESQKPAPAGPAAPPPANPL